MLPPRLERQTGHHKLKRVETHELKLPWEQVLEEENWICNGLISGGSVIGATVL